MQSSVLGTEEGQEKHDSIPEKKVPFQILWKKNSAKSVAILFYGSSQCTGDDNKVQPFILNLHLYSDESSGLK